MPIPANRRVLQSAHIVNDLEAACMKWVRTTGIGPFLIVPHIALSEYSYRGQKGEGLDFSVAIAQAGGIQIELIEQHCDRPSAYRDLIAKGQQGFHHICFYLENYDATQAFYTDQGHVAAIDGMFGETRFCYIDTTAEIGCMVELVEQNEFQSDYFRRIVEAAENWDGKTDPVRPGFPQ